MIVCFMAYFLFWFFAFVEASPYLSTSTSTSLEVGTSTALTDLQLASPTCFQPRASNDPPGSQIIWALTNASAVTYACNNATAQHPINNTFHYPTGGYSFDIAHSRSSDPNSDPVQTQNCSQQFQSIISICILQRSFWGGWIQIGSANWSVSNKIYHQALPFLSMTVVSQSVTNQLPETHTSDALATKPDSTASSTVLSEDPSRLILAIEDVVSNAKISLGAEAAAISRKNDSEHSISSRETQVPVGAAFKSSGSLMLTLTGASTTASPGNLSRLVASFASQTQQNNSSGLKTKPSSQLLQQGALSSPVSFFARSTPTTGLQTLTTGPLLVSSVGGDGSKNTTPISGTLIISPNNTIIDAFRANLSTTTVSASNGAVLVYSMQTFADLANRTGTPILVQTTVPETLANGSHVTYSGGVWVASGGRYWFPPGIPKPEIGGGVRPGIVINPPCIEPFCSGMVVSNGGGGGDPEGDAPPPYEPPTPPSADPPPTEQSGGEPDQETRSGESQTAEQPSQARSQSAQKTTLPTVSTSFSGVSAVSRVTSSSSSTASSSMLTYGIANLSDGAFVDFNLSIADANAATLDALSLINMVIVPDGILWAPTGTQEQAYAAQATSFFDLALPKFANFTEVSSLSASTKSMSAPSTTISTDTMRQTISLSTLSSSWTTTATVSTKVNVGVLESAIVGLSALATQLTSSSAVATAAQPPSPSPAIETSTLFSHMASPNVLLACTQL